MDTLRLYIGPETILKGEKVRIIEKPPEATRHLLNRDNYRLLNQYFHILHRRLGYPHGRYPCDDTPTKEPEPAPTSTSADAPEALATRQIRRIQFRGGCPGGYKARGPGARGRTGGRNQMNLSCCDAHDDSCVVVHTR